MKIRGKLCAVFLLAALFTGVCGGACACAAQEQEKAAGRVFLGSQRLYAVKQNETIVTVPIYADGADLRAYALTVTYDTEVLALTGVEMTTDGVSASREVTETLGTVQIAGASAQDAAASANGQIGTLTFLLKEKIRDDGVRTPIGLSVREAGISGEETEASGCIVLLNRSKAEKTGDVQYSYGDVNKDGAVSASDALAVLKHVVGLETDAAQEFDTKSPLSVLLADADADETISASDALSILRTVVSLQETRPYTGTLADAALDVQTESYPAATEEPAFDTWAHPEVLDVGDLDGDGGCGADDAQRVLALAAQTDGVSETDRQRADVDGDGSVTEDDALLLVQAATGAYTNFGYVQPDDAHTIYVDSKSYTRGSYCFGSLGEAVAYINAHQPTSESERITVLLAPGVYREHTTLDAPYVTFAAMDEETEQWANITYYYGCGMLYSSIGGGQSEAGADSASTIVSSKAHDFSARHIMFENSYNIYITKEERDDFSESNHPTMEKRTGELTQSSCQTQALALQLNADRSTLYDCRIIGRQDTFLMNDSNRVYCEDCYIEGTVDFIYGSATAVLDGCTINSPYRTGHITAASTPDDQPYGFLLKDCVLTRDAKAGMDAPADGAYSLGRPWRTSAMVTYYCCKMDSHIATRHGDDSDDYDRFMSMGTGVEKEDARYAEYGTMDLDGNLLDLAAICPDYEKILTEADMDGFYAPVRWLEARYNTATKTLEYDGWNPGGYAEPETDAGEND